MDYLTICSIALSKLVPDTKKAETFMESAFLFFWCPEPESNRHTHKARDFKSLVSTNFTTRADGRSTSNYGAYSNTLVSIFISEI